MACLPLEDFSGSCLGAGDFRLGGGAYESQRSLLSSLFHIPVVHIKGLLLYASELLTLVLPVKQENFRALTSARATVLPQNSLLPASLSFARCR